MPSEVMRSKFEQQVAKQLRDKGVRYEYEAYQFPYTEPLRRNRAWCASCGGSELVRDGWYTPDFWLPDNGLFIEAKGRFTAANRRKMLSVIHDNEDETFVMLFMRDNKIHKNSSTYYSDWCMENGVDFAIGTVKEEWIR